MQDVGGSLCRFGAWLFIFAFFVSMQCRSIPLEWMCLLGHHLAEDLDAGSIGDFPSIILGLASL